VHQEFLKLASTVNPVQPWATPGARELDSETVDSWMRRQTDSDFAQYIFRDYTRIGGSGGYEPNAASILHLALTYKAAPQGETPEYKLIVGGAGQMPALLQQQIRGPILTAAAARVVTREADGYRVSAANGTEHRCRSVVVALPPTLRSRIVFEPALPDQVTGFCQRAPMGSMIKVMAVYDSAWWRDEGLSGFAQGQLEALALTADSSPPSGRPGILAGFIAADKAIEIGQLSAAERRRIIVGDLVTYFGRRAATPSDYTDFNWGNTAWVTGGFTSFMTPGAWTSFGPAWREPVGRIVWAGTESSTRWAGYYEGAIQAGLDAAARVRSLLARS
jgi:monoamine oxidase